MKKYLTALLAALMLLGLAGCGGENPPAAQDGQEESSPSDIDEESPNDCENLIEGGICIEKLEKNLQEMGYETVNRPEDWDDNIILVEARKKAADGTDNGEIMNFTCRIRKDGSVKGVEFYYSLSKTDYDDFAAVFSQFVEASYGDILKADPKFADTFVNNYVPVPEELFAKYPENRSGEYDAVLHEADEAGLEVAVNYGGKYDIKSFFYSIMEFE